MSFRIRRLSFRRAVALAGAIALLFGADVAAAADNPAALGQALAGTTPLRFAGQTLDGTALRAFYAARNDRPVWPATPTEAAKARAALCGAAAEGLSPDDYHCAQLTTRDAVAAELLLTDGLLRYAHDMRVGVVAPGSVDPDIDLTTTPYAPGPALEAALNTGTLASFLAGLAPPHPEYGVLKAGLARYRALAAQGGWPLLPPDTRLTSETPEATRALLRARLAIEDPVLAAAGASGDLDAALVRYQRRNGLEPDGILGPRTLAMLNVPVGERISQIAANMERWRWLPRRFQDRYVMVNAAAAQLRVVADGKIVLTSRVIVGKPDTPTPVTRADVVAVTANPPWNVPASIAIKETLPLLKRDPTYLQKHHMVLLNGPEGDPEGLTVDWRAVRAGTFPYRIRQLPGPDNALGLVKLEMPNPFDVYLHDTPGRSLFARQTRTLSHGCVRVQQIVPLAAFALDPDGPDDLAAARKRLEAAIAAGQTTRLPLNRPLPVYVLYWTTVAAGDEVAFRPDIYGRDTRLIAAMAARGAGATIGKRD